MIRALFLLFFTLFTLPAAALCTGPDFRDRLSAADRAAVAAAVAETPFASGLVWEATQTGTHLTIVGTMHIYDPRHDTLRARVASALSAADLLLVEAGDAEQAAMEAAIASHPEMIFITDGPTLPEALDEATWQAVMEAARARNIPPFIAAKMQPWYLSLTLSMPPCILPDLMAGREGLDRMLIDDAKAAGVPVGALEPWDTLFTIMQQDGFAAQLEDLKLSLIAPELQSEMFVAMLEAYFAGDVAEVWEVSRIAADYVPGLPPEEARRIFEETEKDLLNDRNAAWTGVIAEAAARHDRIVVAVGAAHLPGERGLLNLLARGGWEITPLP